MEFIEAHGHADPSPWNNKCGRALAGRLIIEVASRAQQFTPYLPTSHSPVFIIHLHPQCGCSA